MPLFCSYMSERPSNTSHFYILKLWTWLVALSTSSFVLFEKPSHLFFFSRPMVCFADPSRSPQAPPTRQEGSQQWLPRRAQERKKRNGLQLQSLLHDVTLQRCAMFLPPPSLSLLVIASPPSFLYSPSCTKSLAPWLHDVSSWAACRNNRSWH
jgi:hypothetical protein